MICPACRVEHGPGGYCVPDEPSYPRCRVGQTCWLFRGSRVSEVRIGAVGTLAGEPLYSANDQQSGVFHAVLSDRDVYPKTLDGRRRLAIAIRAAIVSLSCQLETLEREDCESCK